MNNKSHSEKEKDSQLTINFLEILSILITSKIGYGARRDNCKSGDVK